MPFLFVIDSAYRFYVRDASFDTCIKCYLFALKETLFATMRSVSTSMDSRHTHSACTAQSGQRGHHPQVRDTFSDEQREA